MAEAGKSHTVAWTFKAAAQVEHVAASASAAWVLVADAARRISILDGSGAVRGEFRAGQPVRRLRADPEGRLFYALSGDTIVYAFNAQGQMEWRVELGAAVTDFDCDIRAERLAAVSTAGWLYLYSPQSRERRVAPVGWPMTCVAVAGAEPLRLAVCNDKGRLAMFGADGKPEWAKDLGCPTGGLCAGTQAGLIIVAALEKGMLLFHADGQDAGAVDVGQPVRRAAVTPNGALVMAETADDRLALVRPDSYQVWEQSLNGPPVEWALGEEGRLVVVAGRDGQVAAYRIGGAPPAPKAERARPTERARADRRAPAEGGPAAAPVSKEPAAKLAEKEPAGVPPPEMEEIEWPEYLQVEDAVARQPAPVRAPDTAQPRVVWKTRLASGGPPEGESAFRLSQDGQFLAFVLADGTVFVLDAAGKALIRQPLQEAARLAPRTLVKVVAAWTARQAVIIEPDTGHTRTVRLSEAGVAFFDGSRDLRFFCAIDEAGQLSAFGEGDAPLWRKALTSRPTGLFVSPRGDTVLVPDDQGRFRYYDSEGRLLRKFRFDDQEDHRAVALGDGVSVFASAQGRLSFLDADGRELWSRRLFGRITAVELLGGPVAAYGETGTCAIVEPREDKLWEFQPPPGRVRLRKPPGADPMLVHAAGEAVTVFSGYRRKLDVVWRYACKGEVSALEADRSTRIVVALAGDTLYRLEAPSSSR